MFTRTEKRQQYTKRNRMQYDGQQPKVCATATTIAKQQQ